MLADLSAMISQYRFPTIVDEAMALITDDEVFTSRTDPDSAPPLYSVVIRRLTDYKKLYVLPCGTGMGLNVALKLTASDKMGTETNIKDQHVITISEGFDSEEEVQSFLQQNMVPVSVYCWRSLIWLVGRFAFAAGFVQAWAEERFGRIVDDAILAYKDEFVNTQPIGGGQKRRVVNGVDLAFMLEEAALKMHYFGRGISTDLETSFPLFEEGIARLQRLNDLPNSTYVTISEPMIVAMTVQCFKKVHSKSSFPERLIHTVDYDPSSQGFAFESLIPERLEGLLNAHHSEFEPKLPYQGWALVKPADQLEQPNVFVKQHTDRYKLIDWLQRPCSTAFRPEKEAGPDLVCVARPIEQPDIQYLVMVQTKFRKEGFYGQDIEHSIIAVTAPHLYHRVKIDTVQDGKMTDFQSAMSIISQKFIGTISLVVVYPAVAKYEGDVESLRSDEVKAKGPVISDPHYLLFIGRDNAHLLFDRELLEELQSFKGPKRRRRS